MSKLKLKDQLCFPFYIVSKEIIRKYKPLLDILGVPDDKIIAGGILMGYPKVRYRNIVERQPLDVTFDTEE